MKNIKFKKLIISLRYGVNDTRGECACMAQDGTWKPYKG
jgi:hypothetical protein